MLFRSTRGRNLPSKFARFFSAAQVGTGLTIHAGEEGPVIYVSEALDACWVERIGHGYTAAGHPDLVRKLAEGGIPLTKVSSCRIFGSGQ